MHTKHTLVSRTSLYAIAFALLAGLTAPAFGEQKRNSRGCSDASLEGSYGAYRTGTGPFGPVAGQGILFFDGDGNWRAIVNNSRNGEPSIDEEYAGTYAVNADCTGAFLEEGSELERFVIVDDGKGMYFISLAEGITVHTVATRIHNGHGDRDDR